MCFWGFGGLPPTVNSIVRAKFNWNVWGGVVAVRDIDIDMK